MKQITLKDIRIKEVVIVPNAGKDDVVMAITYEILDANDQVLSVKNSTLKRDAFTQQGKKAIEDFALDILRKVKTAEQFDQA